MSISFWYRIRNRCGVQSPPPDIRWARASPGSGSRDCAHLAAPAKRRNHLRKRSEGRPRKLNHRQAPAPGAAASPRRARAVGELGRSGASLGVPAWICTVCIRVCFCLLIQGAVTWIHIFERWYPARERSPHVHFLHRGRQIGVPRAVTGRFFRSPQRRKVHAVVQGLASRAAARVEAA